jgi:dTDP-4-dehydrorhamnose 3,5-epimerase-like enzyme
MVLALFDGRPDSPTHGRLEVIRMSGLPMSVPYSETPSTRAISLVPIPPGVYHCIGNLGTEPFVLTNFPTELYDPKDEGRVPFAEVTVDTTGGTFDWSLVQVIRSHD